MAMVLAVAAFALVGLPPTAGFIGKLFLLTSAWDHGYNWFVIIAALNTAIAIYYYLGLVRHAYTVDPVDKRQLKPMNVGRINIAWGTVLAVVHPAPGRRPRPRLRLRPDRRSTAPALTKHQRIDTTKGRPVRGGLFWWAMAGVVGVVVTKFASGRLKGMIPLRIPLLVCPREGGSLSLPK